MREPNILPDSLDSFDLPAIVNWVITNQYSEYTPDEQTKLREILEDVYCLGDDAGASNPYC